MLGKKLLIVGLDPGTTTAYAVLDIEGNILALKSQKEFGLNSLISEITQFGKVVITGTDKQKIPRLVESFSAKTGSRVFNPQQDIKVSEKKELIKDFEVKDDHEGDALASALHSFRRILPLMEKIDFIAREKGKIQIRNEIKELVLVKNLSIYLAIKSLEAPKEEAVIMESVAEGRELRQEDFEKIYRKFKTYEKDNKRLHLYNESLKQRISSLESSIEIHEKHKMSLSYKINSLFSHKENRIKNYSKIIKEKNSSIHFLKAEISRFERLLMDAGSFYILKKVDNLGSSSFGIRKIMLNIKKGNILLADDPNIVSSSTVAEIAGKISIIVHNKPISRKIEYSLPFIFISSKSLNIRDFGNIAAVEKKLIDERRNSSSSMLRIVENYKKERMQHI